LEKLARPIIDLFADAAQARPAAMAIDDGVRAYSYGEALERVRALAARIAAQTEPGAAVAGLLPASTDFSIVMLACLAAGRLFVPLDLHYPKAWLADVLASARGAAVVASFEGEAASLVPQDAIRIDLDTLPPAPANYRFTPTGPDTPALLIHTSGSTGRPKGIVNSQRALLRRVQQYADAGRMGVDDRYMPLSSGCTIAGIRERLAALLTGGMLYSIDVQRAGARRVLDCLEATRTSVIYAVPALLRTLIALGTKAPGSLRIVRVGGDAVTWSDVDLFRNWLPEGCRIQLGYSSTEAPILQWFVPSDFPRDGSRIPIGYPLEGGELAILGEDGEPVAAGETGELVVRSPYVALGHWREGALDPSPFPPSPDDPSSRILKTGDLVRLRSDGFLDLIGRKDRQVKIRGIRVEPGELEAVLRMQASLADAAVLPRRLGQSVSLIAYVVRSTDAPADLEAQLKAALKPVLPAHLLPQKIYALDAIPRLPSSKLDMRALEILDRARQADEAANPPEPSQANVQTSVEAKVAATWKRLFGRVYIDRHADFFDLGGDSLIALNMMFALEEELGVELAVTAIFEAPTIASLAALIEESAPRDFSPLVKIKGGEGTPLFIVHGVGGNVMELFAFGRRMSHGGSVYAIQARGVDGRGEPHESIAAMAEDYIGAVRALQPQGRFHLAGYSSGGLVALEMVRRLRARGEDVASLTLLDTQTNSRQWPLAVWLDVLARRLRRHLTDMRTLDARGKLGHTVRAASGLRRRLAWRLGLDNSARPLEARAPVPDALQKVYAGVLTAVAAYRPLRHQGPVTLIVSQLGDPLLADPRRIWPHYVRDLTVHEVPGTHYTMLQGDNAQVLASTLSQVLNAHATA
jgi:acyl-coenzyme A synthetase/AMP-(fatty) acid ligase/thioesterase domain-containing protein/acyl carrier protein